MGTLPAKGNFEARTLVFVGGLWCPCASQVGEDQSSVLASFPIHQPPPPCLVLILFPFLFSQFDLLAFYFLFSTCNWNDLTDLCQVPWVVCLNQNMSKPQSVNGSESEFDLRSAASAPLL
ncbi:hypothetical protein VTK73DRAFT_2354 [Phialemonium thermophilum]|uniref:Uncharacterized protein n=1 Tax=Phialemonium thermophilum TaxID=223376 RepID=A0ABR3VS96_9PEZI